MAREKGPILHLRNVIILVGILVSTIGIIYFAVEFVDRLSDWGRLASLVLLAVHFIALGVYFEGEPGGTNVTTRRGLRWLRVTSALYIIGMVAAFTGVIVFLGIDDLDPLIKLAVTMLLGLALIIGAATRFRSHGAGDPP